MIALMPWRLLLKLLTPAILALEAQKPLTLHLAKQVFLNPRTLLPWAGDAPIRKIAWIPVLKRVEIRYRRPYQM